MASIRARKETGTLYIDFRYMNVRCREQTSLPDTPANRKKLETMLHRMEAEMLLNQFDYASYFPSSNNIKKFDTLHKKVVSHLTSTPLFSDWVETWLNEMVPGWSNSYAKTVKHIVNLRLIPRFGDQLVSAITKADILQFRSELVNGVSERGKSLSPSHINRHIKLLNMILNEGSDRFDFVSPVKNIKPLKNPRADIQPFSLEEVQSIISNVPVLFKNYFTVRFFTGMRTGEVDGLKWRYVDFENKLILVRESWVDGEFTTTKTQESYRDIQMSQPVCDALKQQFELTGNKSSLVFANTQGKPLSKHNVTTRVWYPTLDDLGLERRRPYQTRHTAATLWLASGESPEWIARQMGHANTEMLFRVYSRFVPNLTRNDGSAFERMLQQNL